MTQVTYDIKDIDTNKLEELITANCSFALENIKNMKSLIRPVKKSVLRPRKCEAATKFCSFVVV